MRPTSTAATVCFTGAVPYPEEAFAPFTTRAAHAGMDSQAATNSSPRTRANAQPNPEEKAKSPISWIPWGSLRNRSSIPRLLRGLKLTGVQAGSAAEKVGLHVGDVIRSVNGYVTEQPAHLRWILSHAATENGLKMTVKPVKEDELRNVTLQLPVGTDALTSPLK